MSLFLPNGNLKPGIHPMALDDFENLYGYNGHRRKLITGLKKDLGCFNEFGCNHLYVDGSFVTSKTFPSDIDLCWDPAFLNYQKMIIKYPVFFNYDYERAMQKAVYGCEFLPMTVVAKPPSTLYIDFFQKDKYDNPKGIVKLNF
jgi:hypothetical protein